MSFKLTCLECKNDIDLSKFKERLNKFFKKELNQNEDLIIECNHCGTDHLVVKINNEGEIEAEIIEQDK